MSISFTLSTPSLRRDGSMVSKDQPSSPFVSARIFDAVANWIMTISTPTPRRLSSNQLCSTLTSSRAQHRKSVSDLQLKVEEKNESGGDRMRVLPILSVSTCTHPEQYVVEGCDKEYTRYCVKHRAITTTAEWIICWQWMQ